MRVGEVELDRQQLRLDVAFRVIRDAYVEGCRSYWERRAREVEAARPRRTDFNGQATPQDLADRWQRLTDAAAACRARATLADTTRVELVDTLDDIAAPYDDLEQQLRQALDTGHLGRILYLSRLIDRADLVEDAAA